jgi:hypothetical protein
MGRRALAKEPCLGRPLPNTCKKQKSTTEKSKTKTSNELQQSSHSSKQESIYVRVINTIEFDSSESVFKPESRARFTQTNRKKYIRSRAKSSDDRIPTNRMQYSIEKKKLYVAKFFEMNEKLDVLQEKRITKKKFAEMNNIPVSCFYEWVLVESDFDKRLSINSKAKRLLSTSYPGEWPVLDNALVKYIREMRKQKLNVSAKDLREKATLYASQLEIEPFSASNGYLFRFMKRNKVVRRKITHKAQIDTRPVEIQQKRIIDYFALVDRVLWRFLKPLVLNMDETAVFFDMLKDFTLDFCGVESVDQIHTGFDKHRFSTVLTIASNGEKLPIYIIFRYFFS